MSNTSFKHIRRKQLDKVFSGSIKLENIPQFERGYIREIRESLGMSSIQLSKHLGISQPALARLEHNEQSGVITLKSLKKIAEALDCNFVYAMVPKTSLEDCLTKRAKLIANKIVKRIGHSMSLESQSTSGKAKDELIDEVLDELVNTLDKRLWEQPVDLR